jgi:hypothetical protein
MHTYDNETFVKKFQIPSFFEEFTDNGLIFPVNVNMFCYHLVFFQVNFLLASCHSILYCNIVVLF